MTTKSPCRSPNRWLHDPSCHSTKTWRLRNNTCFYTLRPNNQIHSIPIYSPITMRNNHNQLYLPSTDRPKITHRLLLSKPHSPSHCSYHNPNTMKFHRGHSTHNRPRTHIFPAILPSQYQLRTNPQPNNNHSPRPANSISLNGHMMNYSKPS